LLATAKRVARSTQGRPMSAAQRATMTPAQSRALAVALAVLAVVAVVALVAVPVALAHLHYNRAIADNADRLARYRRIAAQAPEYRKALDAMRARDGRRFFLKNTAANLAGAELQEIVKGAIETNGGRITTCQNPPPRDDGGMKQIVANVQFFATTPVLAKILYAVETSEPYLVIDNLSVRPLNAFRGFKPAAGQEPELNVQFDVVGWALPEPGTAPPPGAGADKAGAAKVGAEKAGAT
jgi:hypothetical protein